MEEAAVVAAQDVSGDEALRVYEVGYHIIPVIAEDQLDSVVGSIRSVIEKHSGNFIAEGAPVSMKLAYEMEAREGDKKVRHDRAYFGWIKFEGPAALARELEATLNADARILRHIIFLTVREETRARMKAPTLREVKRTDSIKPTTRRASEESAPVSEADLDKALSDLTSD